MSEYPGGRDRSPRGQVEDGPSLKVSFERE